MRCGNPNCECCKQAAQNVFGVDALISAYLSGARSGWDYNLLQWVLTATRVGWQPPDKEEKES